MTADPQEGAIHGKSLPRQHPAYNEAIVDPERIGPYRVTGPIGSGGMGTVLKAWDERLQRWVALKAVQPSGRAPAKRVERLRREARALAAVDNPAVARLHDVLEHDGCTYLVMEYVEGRSLTHRLMAAPLDLRDAIRIARQIALGLQAVHDAGMVHRDLKPDNVRLSESGQVKLLDLGLARHVRPEEAEERLTSEGVVLGTGASMSPEQAAGRDLDPRSDLFALGSLLYEMLTGRHPFRAASPLETHHRVLQHRPAAAERLNPAVPPALGRLVHRLLEKDRRLRPSSAAEVVAALDALTQPDRTATWDAVPPSSRRRARPGRVAWTAAVVTIAALVAVAWWLLQRPEPRPVVAVALPSVHHDAGGRSGLAGLLRVAAVDTLAGIRDVDVLPPDLTAPGGSDPQRLARAVAADEVVTVDMRADGTAAEITVRRLAGDDARVLRASHTNPKTVGTADVARMVAELTGDAFGATPHPARDLHPGLSDDELVRYLEVAASLLEPRDGPPPEELLERLHTLRDAKPNVGVLALAQARCAAALGEATGRSDLLERAAEAARDARRLMPQDARGWAAELRSALLREDLATADQALQRLSTLAPFHPLLPRWRADLARRRGDVARAVELLRSASRRAPAWWILEDLAAIDLAHGRTQEARQMLLDELELAPRRHRGRSLLARLELGQGHPARAAVLLRGLLRERLTVRDARDLSLALLLTGDLEEARSWAESGLRLAPGDPSLLLQRSDCELLSGGPGAADPWYRRTLEAARTRRESGAQSHQAEAVALAHLGHHVAAVEAVQQLLGSRPGDPAAEFTAARVYTLAGDRTSAVVSAIRSLDLGLGPRWYELPFFEDLRGDPRLAPRLAGQAVSPPPVTPPR